MDDLQLIEYAAQAVALGELLLAQNSNTPLEIVYGLFIIERDFSSSSMPLLKKLAHHQCFPKTIKSSLDLFINIRYSDLVQDYTYLPNNELIELVSRKLALVPKEGREDPIVQLLIRDLALKLATLLIVSGGDYRRNGIIRMFRKWRDLALLEWESILLNEDIRQLVTVIIDDTDEILAIKNFDHILLPKWAGLIPSGDITGNLQQVKILVLARYYRSIYFARLQKILGEVSVEQLEALIMDMIVRNGLPLGSKIDQTKAVLIYGNVPEYSDQKQMDSHIKQVQQILAEAVSLMPEI